MVWVRNSKELEGTRRNTARCESEKGRRARPPDQDRTRTTHQAKKSDVDQQKFDLKMELLAASPGVATPLRVLCGQQIIDAGSICCLACFHATHVPRCDTAEWPVRTARPPRASKSLNLSYRSLFYEYYESSLVNRCAMMRWHHEIDIEV